MLPINRILVPVDLAQDNEPAIAHALSLARQTGASTLDILHTQSQDWVDEEMSPDPLASFIGTEKGRRMQRLLENAELSGVVARGRLEVGEPAQVIPIVATAGAYDLIVMGTYPQSGLARFLKKGVVAEVVRFAPCPVLTVRHAQVDSRQSGEFIEAASAVGQ